MRSLFARLMTLFLAVILISTGVMALISYTSSRNSYYESTKNYLISQGQDIVEIVKRDGYNIRSGTVYELNETTRSYIREKSANLYNDYGATCIVFDRNRRPSVYVDNIQIYDIDNIISLLNSRFLQNAITAVLDGQVVQDMIDTDEGTIFTVAMPLWDNTDTSVLGAVIIQTAAQVMQAAFIKSFWPIIVVSAVSILVSALVIFLVTRSIVRPITQMEHAATAFAEGDFSIRTEEAGSREVKALSQAFNGMAVQLEELENSRREFLANVSHELRSPITSIQGYLQSMLDGTIPQQDQRQYMQTVLDETRRLSRLINSLLNLSRMERDEVRLALTHFELNELIRRVIITKMQQLEEKEIELDISFAEDPCYVHADSEQITQVLINLVDNALKFTDRQGNIAIHTRTEKNLVLVTVSDDGETVSPEDAPHLFDRFYKADKAHTVGKGTGLGLAICKRIMEKHGQKIYLLPMEKGAAFEFTLEKGEAPSSPAHPDHTAS